MSAATTMIDVFCHVLPRRYVDALRRTGTLPFMLARACAMQDMVDLGTRFRAMDEFPGYQQIPSLSSPPIEAFATSSQAVDLARIANDSLAELVEAHPDRFPSFVASLPLADPAASVSEAERAVRELGAAGIQVFTNINGKPLDRPEYLAVIEEAARQNVPIWLHPTRGMNVPDYAGESVSKFDLWWALGWPHETSVAMGRLVFSGLFERYPECVIVTHHCGGTVPMLEGRLDRGMWMLGSRTPPGMADAVASELAEPSLVAFRRFYADTASFGSSTTIAAALAFFGPDRMFFASDAPFDPEGGAGAIRASLAALEAVEMPAADREKILGENAKRLLIKTSVNVA
jgi:predicted TIM-barrel fold metal-dependent hydrolase